MGVAAGVLASLGPPDITLLSFATIGHVGEISPKWISAQSMRISMGSSIPPFVPGSGQPPPKSGLVHARLVLVHSVSRLANQKIGQAEASILAKMSITFCSKFAEEAFSTTSLAERFFSPRPRSFVSLAASTHLIRLSSAARTAQDSRLRWTQILYDSWQFVDRAAPGSCARHPSLRNTCRDAPHHSTLSARSLSPSKTHDN